MLILPINQVALIQPFSSVDFDDRLCTMVVSGVAAIEAVSIDDINALIGRVSVDLGGWGGKTLFLVQNEDDGRDQ